MKCVCGYERLEYYQTEDNQTVGDEKFIQLEMGVVRYRDTSDYYERMRDVTLFACPKCGTVRMDRW